MMLIGKEKTNEKIRERSTRAGHIDERIKGRDRERRSGTDRPERRKDETRKTDEKIRDRETREREKIEEKIRGKKRDGEETDLQKNT